MMSNELSQQFYNKVAYFEGFRSKAYLCPAGRWTIGYGHTFDVKEGDIITKSKAKELLQDDFALIFNRFNNFPFVLLDHERYAIADFIFNLGEGYFRKSNLFLLLQSYSNALEKKNFTLSESLRSMCGNKLLEYCKYHDAKGIVRESAGLRWRRLFEKQLFLHNKIY